MRLPFWARKQVLKLAGVNQSYTPEELLKASETGKWNWKANSYKQEQTAADISQARTLAETGYGNEAVNLLSNSIIGKTGIVVTWPDERIQDAWDSHQWNAQQPDEPFMESQRRAMRNIAVDGESFGHFIPHTDSLFLEHIDPLLIPHRNAKTLGINRDQVGRPVSYDVIDGNGKETQVAATRIVHTYWGNYTSTRRGKSKLRGAIEPLTDLKTVQSDYKQAVRLLFAFRALVKYSQNAPDIPKRIDVNGNQVVDLTRLARMIAIAPDKLPLVPDGLEFVQPPEQHIDGSLFVVLKKALLAEAARAVGISYFSLASDLEGANFSSLRQGAIEDKDLFYWLLATLLTFVMRCVREWMVYVSIAPNIDSNILINEGPQVFLPEFEFIDPAKQANARKTMFGIGALSLSEIIRQDNRNPDETFRLRAADAKTIQDYMEEYGVSPVADDSEDDTPPVEDPDEDEDKENANGADR